MKIALVGAPGSQKTEVAEQLTSRLGGSTGVIDGYVDLLSESIDVEFGHFAGFVNNLQVAFERYRWELQDSNEFDNLITCGTLIDTVVYTTIHTQIALAGTDAELNYRRADNSARILGQLVWDTWRYDYVFLLPLLENEDEESWNAIQDDHLVKGLEAFFIKYHKLESTTSVDRASEAIAIINEGSDEASSTE